MCLNCVCLHFRRNLRVSMEKRTSRVNSRKIRGSRTSRALNIAERSKTGPHTGVRQGCTAVHPGQKVPKTAQLPHGRPCLDARPAVRPTHGRAWGTRTAVPCLARPCRLSPACGSAFLSVFLFGFASLFGDFSSASLRAFFG